MFFMLFCYFASQEISITISKMKLFPFLHSKYLDYMPTCILIEFNVILGGVVLGDMEEGD